MKQRTGYFADLRLGEFRMDRECQHFGGGAFGDGKIAGPITEVCVSGLEVDRNRIMHAGLHAEAEQFLLHAVAVRDSYGIAVPGMPDARSDRGRDDRGAGEQLRVERGIAAARVGPGIEVAEFHAQDGALQALEPVVVALQRSERTFFRSPSRAAGG